MKSPVPWKTLNWLIKHISLVEPDNYPLNLGNSQKHAQSIQHFHWKVETHRHKLTCTMFHSVHTYTHTHTKHTYPPIHSDTPLPFHGFTHQPKHRSKSETQPNLHAYLLLEAWGMMANWHHCNAPPRLWEIRFIHLGGKSIPIPFEPTFSPTSNWAPQLLQLSTEANGSTARSPGVFFFWDCRLLSLPRKFH